MYSCINAVPVNQNDFKHAFLARIYRTAAEGAVSYERGTPVQLAAPDPAPHGSTPIQRHCTALPHPSGGRGGRSKGFPLLQI